MNNIVNDALALADRINEQIRVIEGCNITKGHMTGAELFILSERELLELEGISTASAPCRASSAVITPFSSSIYSSAATIGIRLWSS